jgi:LacI family transcriptional regulator
MKWATIRDVASAAGVSVSTASKALNGQGKLREETRERVAQAARRLGFEPNPLAQALLAGRSFTVGLITTEMLGARRVDGLIVTGRRIEPRPPVRARPGIPVVYAMTQPADGGAPAVLPDDEGGGRAAAEHLLEIGRRRIAHVAGPERFLAARLRAQGVASALAEASVELCGEIKYGEWTEHWGREAAGQLLASRPDAIFCGSDQIARGVADTLRAVGRRIPDDIALVGFDNWAPMALGALPPLSSVDMCLEDVGRVAAERLLEAIGGERDHQVHTVPSRLVVRESSGGRA